MLRDIVEGAISARTDMEIVQRVADTSRLSECIGASAASIVIMHLADETQLGSYDAMLFTHPVVRLLALVGDGRSAAIYRLRPHMDVVRAVSSDDIVDAIRAAVPAAAAPAPTP